MTLRLTLLGCLLLTGCQTLQTHDATALRPTDEVVAPRVVHARSALDRSENTPAARAPHLWARARMQMQLDIPEHPQVHSYRDWYLKHPKHLHTVTQRAAPYLYLIIQEIEQRQMPMELVLLPIVESAYNPQARSHGNAVGLWQFLAATGRQYGLKQDHWYDGRKDVLASTQAALDYLDRLNRQFEGDWLKSIAAYNAGEGRILKATERQHSRGRPSDFWSLDLPRETSAYVPRLLALADIIKHADKYGIELPEVPNRPRLQQVETGGQVDLQLAAEMAGMSLAELKHLNPGYTRNLTSPDGPGQLLVPIGRAQALQLALAELPPSQRARWATYRVRRGDSLSGIAQRQGSTVAALRKANNLVAGQPLGVGQALVIPGGQPQPAREAAQKRSTGSKEYRVRQGDSLSSIARNAGVTVAELKQWNGLRQSHLQIGQRLKLQAGQRPMATRTINYQVRRGDSLSSIAEQFRISIADLLRWNQLDRRTPLKTGQRLTLRLDNSGA